MDRREFFAAVVGTILLPSEPSPAPRPWGLLTGVDFIVGPQEEPFIGLGIGDFLTVDEARNAGWLPA